MDRLNLLLRTARRVRNVLSAPRVTVDDVREYNWLRYKGEKALQALNENPPNIEKATEILRQKL